MELHAFDFASQLLAKLFVLVFLGFREFLAGGESFNALRLKLFERLEQLGDPLEALERLRLQRGFHLRE